MEIWSFDCGSVPLILRRYPNGQISTVDDDALNLETEADIISLANTNHVKAPKVIAKLDKKDGLGMGFVMIRATGEAQPYKLFKDNYYKNALDKLVTDSAKELALIHNTSPKELLCVLPNKSPQEMIASLGKSIKDFDLKIPIFSYTLRWLENNIPKIIEPRLLHGDFRLGNLLIDANGISAVLDWELAHMGDPAEDLAWLCVPSWRFGRHEKPVAGVGQIEDLLHAYKDAGGESIDPNRLKFWIVFSTLRWGLVTLTMTDIWRKGLDRSVERALIGTRCSEVEIDLLMMLEDEVQFDKHMKTTITDPAITSHKGEPRSEELLQSIYDWMKTDLIPRETGINSFNARVAVNSLSIAKRMLEYQETFTHNAQTRLSKIDLNEEELCEGLYNGDVKLSDKGVLSHLRSLAIERLTIHQPNYAGLNLAKIKWKVSHSPIIITPPLQPP